MVIDITVYKYLTHWSSFPLRVCSAPSHISFAHDMDDLRYSNSPYGCILKLREVGQVPAEQVERLIAEEEFDCRTHFYTHEQLY